MTLYESYNSCSPNIIITFSKFSNDSTHMCFICMRPIKKSHYSKCYTKQHFMYIHNFFVIFFYLEIVILYFISCSEYFCFRILPKPITTSLLRRRCDKLIIFSFHHIFVLPIGFVAFDLKLKLIIFLFLLLIC